jgi:hypothetical protein
MEKAAARPSGEVCHRCLQPIGLSARLCPNCGERLSPANRLPILLGILGLLMLVFVVFVMVKVIRNSDANPAPADQTEQAAPQQQPDRPPPFNP